MGGKEREVGGKEREVGGKEREVGGKEREVGGKEKEVEGNEMEGVGGKEREMGGKELDLFSEHCYRFEKGNVYVLQAFVIILPELVSFYGQNCNFDIYKNIYNYSNSVKPIASTVNNLLGTIHIFLI